MKELRKEEQGRNEGFENHSKLCKERNEGFEDYSKFCKGRNEVIEDQSKLYEGETKLRWIWNKGTNLSKKTVVMGVVISTAPLILPSLMALSVIGIAFSLPTWFGLATYACTDKLMDTLLPVPSPPSYVEDEYRVGNDDDEVDEGYEEDDKEDIIKEFETGIELGEEKDKDLHMNVPEIVEEDVGEYMDDEKQYLDTTAIPITMEGVEMPKDYLSTFVIEEEVSGRRENDDDQLPDELMFVSARGVGKETENDGDFADVSYDEMTNETTRLLDEGRDDSIQQDNTENEQNQGVTVNDIPQESGHNNLSVISEEVKPVGHVSENLAGIGDEEQRNETVGLLEQIRDEGRQQSSLEKGACKENEENRGFAIKDMAQEKESQNLPVIPEEVKSASIVRSDNLNETVNERAEKRNEAEIALEEQSEILIERMTVVNVETSGDHISADLRQGTVLDENVETLIISSVAAVEIDNESGFDDQTAVPRILADLLHKGEELTSSKTVVDVSIDYQEVKIESVPLSKHAETRIDQGSVADSDKESGSAEKLWEQIQNIRTIVGYTIAPHASYLEELKALYMFTGVELPVSSTDTGDLADATEKLHFLMSIVGVM